MHSRRNPRPQLTRNLDMIDKTSMNAPAQPARRKALVSGLGVGAASLLSASIEALEAEDIADGVAYMVTRPRHAAIGEMWVMPTEQAGKV
jgi:hypothetical protein